jgi:putative flippase GtrA
MFRRFLLVGGVGFVMDAGLTRLLIELGLAPWLARVPAILSAMTFTWLANRRFTYEVKTSRSANEALRYALVATTMTLVNYSIYVVLISLGIPPVAAITFATACQSVMSFLAFRHLVFMDSESRR